MAFLQTYRYGDDNFHLRLIAQQRLKALLHDIRECVDDHILGAEVTPLHQRHHRWVHMAIGNGLSGVLDDQVIGLETGVTLPNTHHHHFAPSWVLHSAW